MTLLLYAALVWLLLVLVAVANGVFRVAVLTPWLGEGPARALASLLLCAAVLLAACLFVRRLRVTPSGAELLAVGALWVGLTVAFEFGFGHYVMGAPWEELLADYDILRGRLWPLVLVTNLVAPLLAGWLCRR